MSHFSMYLLLPKDGLETSEEARDEAERYLVSNHFVSDEGGRWNNAPSDWFVIGGRWSGELTVAHLDPTKWEKYCKAVKKKLLRATGPGHMEKEQENRKRATAMFHKRFPDMVGVESPYTRDGYATSGYEDDAMILDDAVWEKLIKPGLGVDLHKGGAVVHAGDFEGMEEDIVKEDVVGKCWVCTVDFHC